MKIRRLQERDLTNDFLETLRNLSRPPTEQKTKVIFTRLREHPNILTFVAEDGGGEIVGSITIIIEQKFIHDGGKAAHIEDVVVRKGFEGVGVGGLLVRYAISVAEGKGCYKVILNCNESVAGFYRELGFRESNLGMRFDLK